MRTLLLPRFLLLLCILAVLPAPLVEGKVSVPKQDAQPALKVGDKAPALAPEKWLQGGPITIEPGKCYMVEFWATWCGPCVALIPHLEALHRKYKDKGLVVIGFNSWEPDEKKVQAFLDKRKNEMTYPVAFPGANTPNWLKMAGQNGIPCSFLIDKNGTIAAISHPMLINDSVIEALLAGKSIQKAMADEQERSNAQHQKWGELVQKMEKAKEKKDWKAYEALLGQLEKDFPENKTENAFARLELSVGKKDASSTLEAVRKLAQEDMGMVPYVLEIAAQGSVSFSKENLSELKSLAQKAVDEIKSEHDDNSFALMSGASALSRILFLEGNRDGAIATLDAIKLEPSDEEARIIDKVRTAMKNSFKKGTMPDNFIHLFNQVAQEEVRQREANNSKKND